MTKVSIGMLAVVSALISPNASADPPVDPCAALLDRVSDAAVERGYVLTSTSSGFTGELGRTLMHAECDAGYVEIDLIGERGSSVSVDFSVQNSGLLAIELYADFPLLGFVSRTGVVDDPTTTPMSGFFSFTAETIAATAPISANTELDLDSGTWSSSGNITEINSAFAPVLNASTIWKDAHIFMFTLAGMWESGVDQYEPEFDSMLDLAVALDPVLDEDVNNAEKVCWTSSLTCGVAIIFAPAAGACAAAASACFTALGCIKLDCEEDGHS